MGVFYKKIINMKIIVMNNLWGVFLVFFYCLVLLFISNVLVDIEEVSFELLIVGFIQFSFKKKVIVVEFVVVLEDECVLLLLEVMLVGDLYYWKFDKCIVIVVVVEEGY